MRYPRSVGLGLLLLAAFGFWALLREAHMLAVDRPMNYSISELPEFALALPLVVGGVLVVLGRVGAHVVWFDPRKISWSQVLLVAAYVAVVVAIHRWRADGIAALGYKFFFNP